MWSLSRTGTWSQGRRVAEAALSQEERLAINQYGKWMSSQVKGAVRPRTGSQDKLLRLGKERFLLDTRPVWGPVLPGAGCWEASHRRTWCRVPGDAELLVQPRGPGLRPPLSWMPRRTALRAPGCRGDAAGLVGKSDGKVPPKPFWLAAAAVALEACVCQRPRWGNRRSTRDTGDRSHSGGGTCLHSPFLGWYKGVLNRCCLWCSRFERYSEIFSTNTLQCSVLPAGLIFKKLLEWVKC